MNLLGLPLLSALIWLPALGALLLFALPVGKAALYRAVALGTTLVTLALTVVMTVLFFTGPYGPSAVDVVGPPLQFVDRLAWIPNWGSQYLVGVDGINLWLLGLTAFLAPFAVVMAGRSTPKLRTMLALILLLETGMLGVFAAQDLLLFYVFWEVALLPMVFLVGMWGGHGRSRAALRLFLYTFSGSVLMLFGIIALYVLHRNAIMLTNPGYTGTFELSQILLDLRSGAFVIDPLMQRILFGTFFIAFAIKLALWPLHTWLPDAYTAAPTPAAILLAAVMSKFGTYGLIRFNLTLFPEVASWAAPAIATLAVIGIIYGAIVAFAQTDMQRLVAYASISHLNFIALGIFALNAIGISGAIVQMVNHGINTAALMLIVAVLYDRRQIRDVSAFGGLWKVMPAYAGLTLLVLLATMGLPGLNAFVGELTVMQGAFTSVVLGWQYVVGAAIGVILTAAYLLRMFRIGFMGEVENAANADLPDLNRREKLIFAGLVVPVVAFGLFPGVLFAPLQGTVAGLVQEYLAPITTALGPTLGL
jgi:NADH-quinone oxidoreductase subunit M